MIEWHLELRDIKDLKPHPKNPRRLSKHDADHLKKSLDKFGLIDKPIINLDDKIIGGHQRIAVLKKMEPGRGHFIQCWVPNRHLEDKEIDELCLRLNRNIGEWDMDILANEFQTDDLQQWGFTDEELCLNVEDIPSEEPSDECLEPPKDPKTKLGDVYAMGPHRLVCGDSTDPLCVKTCLGDNIPILMVTDPPYGVNYDPSWRGAAGKGQRAYGKVQNDDKVNWALAWSLFPGSVAYVWHAGKYCSEVQKSLEEAEFEIINQIIWMKQHFALSRGDYHWQHEPCQPSGTMVQKVVKEGRWKDDAKIESVPIETLKAGDRVVSFGNSKIYRNGRNITKIGSRNFSGNMHLISIDARMTKCTPEHQFTTRFDPKMSSSAILYLMRRGKRYRMGVCRLFNSRGFGLAVRLSQELGDDAWIISSHKNLNEARIFEQIYSCKYGIPTTHWEIDRNKSSKFSHRSLDEIEKIYHGIGLENIIKGAEDILEYHLLSEKYPFISKNEIGRFSRKQSRIVRACNLFPEIMQLPVPCSGESFEWISIKSNETQWHQNIEVFSMDVDVDMHYVSDGIVTHNCWYAIKKGHNHNWQGARDQATTWEISNLNAFGKNQDDERTAHSTQKPLECMAKPIRNNTSEGEGVYDPFLGSGTTLMACEQNGRISYGLELDPAYCDIIVQRWVKYRKKIGKEFIVMKNDTICEDFNGSNP